MNNYARLTVRSQDSPRHTQTCGHPPCKTCLSLPWAAQPPQTPSWDPFPPSFIHCPLLTKPHSSLQSLLALQSPAAQEAPPLQKPLLPKKTCSCKELLVLIGSPAPPTSPVSAYSALLLLKSSAYPYPVPPTNPALLRNPSSSKESLVLPRKPWKSCSSCKVLLLLTAPCSSLQIPLLLQSPAPSYKTLFLQIPLLPHKGLFLLTEAFSSFTALLSYKVLLLQQTLLFLRSPAPAKP